MTAPRVEYRVVWKREGLKPKRKRYANRHDADRMLVLLGPEPWTAYESHANGTPITGDELECCGGGECGCGGLTHRQKTEERRKEMPALEWVRVEVREVGTWKAATA